MNLAPHFCFLEFQHFIATNALSWKKLIWIYPGIIKDNQKIINAMYTEDKTKLPDPLIKEILKESKGNIAQFSVNIADILRLFFSSSMYVDKVIIDI